MPRVGTIYTDEPMRILPQRRWSMHARGEPRDQLSRFLSRVVIEAGQQRNGQS
jgi:hypothetical protein